IIKDKHGPKGGSQRVAQSRNVLEGDAVVSRQGEKERERGLEEKSEPEREAPMEGDSPRALSAIPAQSKEVVDKPRQMEAEAIKSCKVKLTRAEMPATAQRGSKVTVILHVTINPPARQMMALTTSIRIMQNSKPIGDEIQGTIHVLPGRDALEIRAPIRVPWWPPAGDYYLEVKFSDSAGVMHSVGRIGFNMS
ncbi:MAG TPA: hypothetical protein VLX28_03180, partial [Thermoanaerobaculia bacterium]|nr:hypothetical protein [Thermoanaerobaculia bacterium]